MADLIGQKLGQYEIVELLGEGGMASVYRARQLNIKRDVAVKVIKRGKANQGELDQLVKRFEREGETIATLDHPHILKLFDYGQHEGQLYLVVPLLTGGSLADLIQQKKLSLAQVNKLLEQIASALDYAHRQGIIHRDLKPQNVLFDSDGNAILTDFGIAKVFKAETELTQSGTTMGTPLYMAPELWRNEPVDGRADIYALGVILYEVLIGKVPFQGDTPFQVMHGHIYDRAIPVHTLKADLPEGIDRVLNKALAKDREERYATAGELVADFKIALAGKIPSGVGVVPPQDVTIPELPVLPSEKPKIRRSMLVFGAVVLVALIGVLVVVLASGIGIIAPTATPTATATPTYTTTPTATPTATNTPTATPTYTTTPTATPTYTLTYTATPTFTATATNTPTATPTYTATPTFTPTVTPTPTPTFTVTSTSAPTATLVPVGADIKWEIQTKKIKDVIPVVYVPAGCFTMGEGTSAKDQCIDEPFWIQQDEVSVALYQTCASCFSVSPGFKGAQMPITQVTQLEAAAFCQAYGGKLPDEKQWEYAARGPQGNIYPWGNDSPTPNRAVFSPEGEPHSGPAAINNDFPDGSSRVGAYHMAGNVSEWTSSLYTDPAKTAGATEDAAIKGGAYSSSANGIQSTKRVGKSVKASGSSIGFRCVFPAK